MFSFGSAIQKGALIQLTLNFFKGEHFAEDEKLLNVNSISKSEYHRYN